MELKHILLKHRYNLLSVLIVPYGIETNTSHRATFNFFVLIVPYGIETSDSILKRPLYLVLIVPYGIETDRLLVFIMKVLNVLIVPYGIETFSEFCF